MNFKMKKTKIICTMGPNTSDPEILRGLAENGMDVARFNFSHGTHPEHKDRLELLKRIRKETDRPIAALLDTKGPEIRTGLLKGGQKVALKDGQEFLCRGQICPLGKWGFGPDGSGGWGCRRFPLCWP